MTEVTIQDNFALSNTHSVDFVNIRNHEIAPRFISSPQSNPEGLSFSVSTITCIDENNFSNSSSQNSDADNQPNLNQVSNENFLLCVNEIIAKHGTSDAEANDWLKLIRKTFPEKNFPSYKTIKKRYTFSKKDEKLQSLDGAKWELWKLDFVSEIKQVVEDNFDEIWSFSASRNNETDLQLPAFFNEELESMRIFLLLNSDGVRIINSNKQSLWPIWFAIAKLPPIKRCMYRNIVLARLWFGRGKPNWDCVFSVSVFA